MKFKLLLLSLLVLVVSACGTMPAPPIENIQIRDIWVSGAEIAKTGNAVVHMTLENTGTAPGRLLLVTSNLTTNIHLRNGETPVVGGIEIPVNGQVEFKPDGYNVYLIGLNPVPKVGDAFAIGLSFNNGDNRFVNAVVRP